MRKIVAGLVVATVLSVGFMPGAISAEVAADIQLTEEQKTEMAALQKEVFAKKKEVINKYVEYGVFTEEKGQKIIAHMDKYYNKLEQDGFIPKWDKKHHKHHQDKEE
ncbi:YckD family protein [Alkalihalobacillus sp. MEB130]|uniref:YckD family protein n=1 Tax=Alkalihalobacillus sp. MEB130 TaxID=2976704 RepID=UPI0028E080AB|nr:YckD family protein [Alkalihalobacillus sp. MEB130]MDT8858851.1 YckD family protein [Alkalihalobacillus sp. MEB130]